MQTGSAEERSCTAHDEQSGHTALLGSRKNLGIVLGDKCRDVGVGPAGIICANHRVFALGESRDGIHVGHIFFDGGHCLAFKFGRVTNHGRHLVATCQQFIENSGTHKTGRSNQ